MKAVTGWLARRRRRPGTRPEQRAGSVHTQAVLVLRWLRHRLELRLLARDAGVSIATAYRYLHEGLDVIAAHAPDLHDVLGQAHDADLTFLGLDGTLVPTDRVAARAEAGHNLWYSGKHHVFGGNVQVLCAPTGFPLWVSDVRPGCTHDLTAAREMVLPAVYPHAARGLPTLADKGYDGAGAGVLTPTKGRGLHPDNATRNELISCLRAPGERGIALLKTRWKALNRIRLCPQRIGAITAAALVLTTAERPIR
ncbi:MAG: transposase family protein [Actinomycetota bacterium]|nr:transposase family protein [Actinomycetota bacterium]